MTLLLAPDARRHRSFIGAVEEFDGARMDGAGPVNDMSIEELREASTFAALVTCLSGVHDVVVEDGTVPATSLWMVRDDEVVGFVQIRHRLTPFLLEMGGHIGYSVRPSSRRRGLASQALAEALLSARGLGLDRVLITCLEGNLASRVVIERSGGVYEDARSGRRRYWARTTTSVR